MNSIKFPRFVVVIGIGLIALVIAYLLVFPSFGFLAYVVLGLGILLGLAAESFRRGYSKAEHMYVWDYLGNENPVATAKRPDGTMVTPQGEGGRAAS